MKLLALLLLLAVCLLPFALPVTLVDSQGREFIRVRAASDAGDGLTNAELWQLVGAVGEEHPFYLRLLTQEGQPPMFTLAQ